MEDLVTVIMPAYNCEKYVKEAINSVLKQTYTNLQLIVIDDGSTDNTLSICKSIRDNRILVLHQENKGPSSARNLGLANVKGKYIMFIDSDDKYCDNTIELLVSSIKNHNCEIVCGNYYINGIENKKIEDCLIKKEYCVEKLMQMKIFNTNWNKIYLADIILNNGLYFDEKYKLGEDIRFNLKYFEHVESCYVLSKYIYLYTFSENGITLKNNSNKCEREVILLSVLYDYFKVNGLNMKYISDKIAKAIFFLNNVDFIMSNGVYFNLLKKAKKYSRLATIVYILIKGKMKMIIKMLLNLKGSKI